MIKAFLSNKPLLYLSGASLALLVIAGLYIWVLRSQAEADSLTITGLKADVALLTESVTQRDAYIAYLARRQSENRDFVKRQYDSMEELKKDAPVDPDILGSKFFNSLR